MGLDADQFIYLSSKDSNAARGTDTIRDFETGIDRLDLSALHPKTGNDKFSFIGNDAFGARAGQVRFEQHDELGTANDYTLVQASLDGGHKIDLEIKLTGLADLTKTDFAL